MYSARFTRIDGRAIAAQDGDGAVAINVSVAGGDIDLVNGFAQNWFKIGHILPLGFCRHDDLFLRYSVATSAGACLIIASVKVKGLEL